MFGGVDIVAVAAGTVIKNGDEELEVSETNAVHKGNRIYMTPKHFELLKKQTALNANSPRSLSGARA